MSRELWSEHAEKIVDLFITSESDGVPLAEITRAEQRFGLRIPPMLRTFYERFGRNAAITQSLYTIPPHLNGFYSRTD